MFNLCKNSSFKESFLPSSFYQVLLLHSFVEMPLSKSEIEGLFHDPIFSNIIAQDLAKQA